MDDLDPFEPGTHTFRGTVRVWATTTAEVVTDSGLVVFLDVHGQPPMPPGARIAIETRKYRPCHLVTKVVAG